MATTIVTKYGSGAPADTDLVRGELAVDTENGRLYTETSGGAVIEIGRNPSGNVDVTGSATFTGTASGATASSVGNKVVIDDAENGISILSSTSGAGYLIFGDSDDNDIGMLIYDHSANALRTYVNGAERVTISSAGNFGIGTSLPDRLLTLQGDNSYMWMKDADGGNVAFIGGDGSNDGFLRLYNGSHTAKVEIQSDGDTYFNGGNVGIGTSSPSSAAGFDAKLQLESANPMLVYKETDQSTKWEVGAWGGNYVVYNGTSERMRISSAGNLNVARSAYTSASTNGFHANADGWTHTSANNEPVAYFNRNTSDGDVIRILKAGATVGSIGAVSDDAYIVTGDTGIRFNDGNDGIWPVNALGAARDNAIDLGNSGVRFKDIHLSGIANIGGTAKFASWSNSGASNGIEIRSTDAQILNSHTGTATHVYQYFYNANGIVGSISASGSSTAYNTSSDYRLKENVVAMSGATERLKQLKPSRFNFIADSDTTVDGFLAHEVQDIVPEAITGTKDAVDDDGNPEYQGIDQSKLVPLLVATIQELEARIAALES